MTKTKQISFSAPDFLMEKIEEDINQSFQTRSETLRHAMIYYLTQGYTVNTDLQNRLNEWEEQVREAKALAGGKGRKTIDYTVKAKRLKRFLRKHQDEPVALRHIADALNWNRMTTKKVINHFDGDFLVVCGEGLLKRGESWQIAMVDTPAAVIVESLIKDRTKMMKPKKKAPKKKEGKVIEIG
jgi:hypothetical protein